MKGLTNNRFWTWLFACICAHAWGTLGADPLPVQQWLRWVAQTSSHTAPQERLKAEQALDQACQQAKHEAAWRLSARLEASTDRGLQASAQPTVAWQTAQGAHLSLEGLQGPAAQATWEQPLYGGPPHQDAQVVKAQKSHDDIARDLALVQLEEQQWAEALALYWSWWQAHQNSAQAAQALEEQRAQESLQQHQVALGQEAPEAAEKAKQLTWVHEQALAQAHTQQAMWDAHIQAWFPDNQTSWEPVCPDALPESDLWPEALTPPDTQERLEEAAHALRRAQQRALAKNQGGVWRGLVKVRADAADDPRHDLRLGVAWTSPPSHPILRHAEAQRLRWNDETAHEKEQHQQRQKAWQQQNLQQQRQLVLAQWQEAEKAQHQASQQAILAQKRYALGQLAPTGWQEAQKKVQAATHHHNELTVRIWQLWAEQHSLQHTLRWACAAWLGGVLPEQTP